MKVKYLSKQNFIKLVNKFKPNARMTLDTHGRHPFETHEEWKKRFDELVNQIPNSLTYHGKKHIIEFRFK